MRLRPAERDKIRGLLALYVPEFEVWAFGSRVHGRRVKRHSDLDLAIITGSVLPLNRLLDLKAAFAESDLPFRVDIIDWSSTDPEFQRIVAKNHEVLASPRSS